MRRRRSPRALALLLALAVSAGACDDGGPQEPVSTVVIHVNFPANVPSLYQIRVNAHLGSAGMDASLVFPDSPTRDPIPSGATLALLIPTTRMGLLDLIVAGLDTGGSAVAMGNGQTTIEVGKRVDVTIQLSAL
jgi:hypothetical protein